MALNWDDLKVLLALARAGSMARAGVMLGIDQSTVGRRLAALEATLGGSLFLRGKTGVSPTELGRGAIAHALEVERRIDRMAEEAAPEGAPEGTVRLVGNTWVLERLAQTVLAPFLADHPGLKLRLIARLPVVLARSDPTVSLWFEAPHQSGEFSVALGEVAYAVYGRKDADPASLEWLSFFDEDAPRRQPVRVLEASEKLAPEDLRLTATDAQLLFAAVRAGVGKALLPVCLGDSADDLTRLGVGPAPLVRVMHLHAHPDTVQSRRVQATIRWLRESFRPVFGGGVSGPQGGAGRT